MKSISLSFLKKKSKLACGVGKESFFFFFKVLFGLSCTLKSEGGIIYRCEVVK